MRHDGLRRASALIAIAAFAIATRGCHSVEPATSQTTIRVAHNDWLGATINDAIAKILLEEKLGYRVELVPAGTSTQWPLLAQGNLHVALEIWPSGHKGEIDRYLVSEGTVENAGALGPVARKGFYFPTYLLDKYPELTTWTAYTDPSGPVTLFRTKASGDKGQLLSGDPTWVTYDDQLIKNLNLQLVSVYAGSEDAEVDALRTAYASHEPLLLFFWLPHWAFNAYDLTKLELPAYSDACYARAAAAGVDCDYPPEQLTKVVWSGLKTYAPSAYELVRRFSYSTLDQVKLMGRVKIAGLTVEDAAREWVNQNEDVWRAWVVASP
jgi:glycine betaine/proline transport system substrate-binding protein